MQTVACRSCGASIGFIELPSAKKMPVDPELVRTMIHPRPGPRPGERHLVLVTERGTIVRGLECSVTDGGAEAVAGYVSHFATCTDPKAQRR